MCTGRQLLKMNTNMFRDGLASFELYGCEGRRHGGAQGSGAPQGNRNDLTDGFYTAVRLEPKRQIGAIVTDRGPECRVRHLANR
jgi:hypothetical protein